MRDSIYHDIILDHSKNPRNFFSMKDATHVACGDNPLCGDSVKVMLKVRNDILEEASFKGVGCALSLASASIMTEIISNQEIQKALNLVEVVKGICTQDVECKIRKLMPFSGVREFPLRVKCVTMAWHTMRDAIGRL